MIEAIVLASGVSAAILYSYPNEQGRQAVNNIALATYKYTELDKVIQPYAKDLEKKYVSNGLRNLGIGASFIYRLVKDNEIEYTWSF
jgi:hypothetical protein